MTPTPNTIGDELTPLAAEGAAAPLELNEHTQSFNELLSAVRTINDNVHCDDPTRSNELNYLVNAINNVEIFIHGTNTPLHALLSNADAQKNARILRAIEAGFFSQQGEVEYLTDAAATALATKSSDSGIYLNNLKTLTDRQADILSQYRGTALGFCDLRQLTDHQAKALASFGGNQLKLTGLATITSEQVASIATFSGEELQLSMCFGDLDDEEFAALMKFRGRELSVNIRELTDAKAQSLTKLDASTLILNRLEILSDAHVDCVACGRTSLCLWSLHRVTQHQMEVFAEISGTLSLGITKLTNAQAIALSQFKGKKLNLPKLLDINKHQAKILAPLVGKVEFDITPSIMQQLKKASLRLKDRPSKTQE
jgi:hypothetical protein